MRFPTTPSNFSLRERLRVPAAALLCCLLLLPACGGSGDSDEPTPGARRYGVVHPDELGFGEGTSMAAGTVEAPKPAEVKPDDTPKPPPRRTTPPPTRRVKYKENAALATGGGTITGVITVPEGTAPNGKLTLDRDVEACGHSQIASERLIFDEATRGLANCVVSLDGIKEGKPWAGEMAKGEDDRVAILDQKGCVYVPHVMVMRTNTQIRILNSDPAEHNVNDGKGNNILTSAGAELEDSGFYRTKAEVVTLKCNIHAWMSGYVHVRTNPYYAVTGKDGKFELTNVPAGEYELTIWHEGVRETPILAGGAISGYEYSPAIVKTVKVTVAEGGTVTVNETLPLDG